MAVHYLGDNGPDGVCLGTSATEKVAMYGSTPVVQPSAITSLASSAATSTVAATVNEIITALRNLGAIAT